jgi:hypothetical protein
MKTDEMFPSRWLKAKDIPKGGLAVTIKSLVAGTLADRKTGEVRRVYSITFDEIKKPLTLNKVNAEAIAAWYGNETDGWIGQPITLVRLRAQVFDRVQWVVRVQPPEDEEGLESGDEGEANLVTEPGDDDEIAF